MRGIILAGGTGSRLAPLTRSVNKHLLPIAGVPMIEHPLRVLLDNSIDDVTVVSSAQGVGQIAAYLGSGASSDISVSYRVQDEPGGIAQALLAARTKSNENVAVILGDNIFENSPQIPRCWDVDPHTGGCFQAMAFVTFVRDIDALRQFGVVAFSGERVCAVEEKPAVPQSSYAVCGFYVFTAAIWGALLEAQPSARGELEITDILDRFAKRGELRHQVVDGLWGDAGTHDGMRECDEAMRKVGAK